jgi:tol-pal system protein YbgF
MLSLPARALLCGVAAVALAGCASGRGAQAPQDGPPARVTLADMKNAQDAQAQEIARLAGDVKAMDAQQAFLVAEIKNLNEQVAKLQGSLSEAEGAMRSMRATPVPPESRPAPAVVPPPAAATRVPIPLPAPAPRPAAPAAATPVPAGSAPALTAPPSRNAEADRLFAAALAKLRAGDDGQAALEFTEFVAQFPSHPQAAAAQNHIGEAYYRQRDYRQAVAEFQKTVDGYTQAAQVSEALLKIGLCQRALGDAARAKASWEQVVKQFPKSDAARQARTLLGSRAAAGR